MSSRFFLLCSLCNISANYLSHLVVSAFSTNRFTLYTAMLIFISVPLSPKTPVRHFFQFLFIKAIQSDNNIIYIRGLELVLGCSHSSFLTLTSGSAKMSPSRGQNTFMAAKMVFYYSVFIYPGQNRNILQPVARFLHKFRKLREKWQPNWSQSIPIVRYEVKKI